AAPSAAGPSAPASPLPKPAPARHLSPQDIEGVRGSRRETAHIWDMRTDAMPRDRHAMDPLSGGGPTALRTGTAFQLLIAPEHAARRIDAIRQPSLPRAAEVDRTYRVQ